MQLCNARTLNTAGSAGLWGSGGGGQRCSSMDGLDVTIYGPVIVPLPHCSEAALAARWARRDNQRARLSSDEDSGKDGRMKDCIRSNKCRKGKLLIFKCGVT